MWDNSQEGIRGTGNIEKHFFVSRRPPVYFTTNLPEIFLTTLPVTKTMHIVVWLLNNELERMWKETIVL
jgi:hypothetical protein